MDEEKDLIGQEVEETETPVTEETVEETEEIEDSVVSEPQEVVEIPQKSEMSKGAVAAISVIATLVVCLVAAFAVYKTCYNPYNNNKDGYGMTLAAYAEQSNKQVSDIKNELGLPKNMRDDTLIEMVQYYIPAGKMAENYGMSFDELLSATGIKEMEDANVTEDTLWGEVTLLMEQQQKAQRDAESDEATTEPTEDTQNAESTETTENAESTENTAEAE